MKLHRFYVYEQQLQQEFWLKSPELYRQWVKVLRFQKDREVVLFNDQRREVLYRIAEIGSDAVQLLKITDMEPKLPKTELYLCFALLKKDKNDWVLQKATELGVSHFIPMLTERTEKTGFNVDRAQKIVIEAAEQCGRADIPRVREPIGLQTAIHELQQSTRLVVAEQSTADSTPAEFQDDKPIAILVGPEGGWTDEEKRLFIDQKIEHFSASEYTLRAETASIAMITKWS